MRRKASLFCLSTLAFALLLLRLTLAPTFRYKQWVQDELVGGLLWLHASVLPALFDQSTNPFNEEALPAHEHVFPQRYLRVR